MDVRNNEQLLVKRVTCMLRLIFVTAVEDCLRERPRWPHSHSYKLPVLVSTGLNSDIRVSELGITPQPLTTSIVCFHPDTRIHHLLEHRDKVRIVSSKASN